MDLYKYEIRDFSDNYYFDLVVANNPKEAISIVRASYGDAEYEYKIDSIEVVKVESVCGYRITLEK